MTLIKFEFKNSKSLKIYPKSRRVSVKNAMTQSEADALKALRESEKELKHVMGVANMGIEKIDQMIRRDVDDGLHLRVELFIPEYLGFKFIADQDKDGASIHIYSKDGYNLSRIDNTEYLVLCPNGQKPVLRIKNMYEAIMILSALGMDLNFADFMDGKYTEEKTLDEIAKDVIDEVIENRTKAIDHE